MARMLLCTLLLWPGVGFAQTLTGTYVYQSPAGPVTLSLQEQGATVSGTMTGADGSAFVLQGSVENGRATGTVRIGDGSGWFAAGFVGQRLKLVVAEVDPATGQPNLSSGWELDFSRTGGAPVPGAQGGAPGVAPGAAQGGPPEPNATSPVVQEWLGHLTGKRLSYRESYNSNDARGFGGYSNRWDAYLCSDGTFYFQSRSRMSADVGGVTGSAGGNEAARGTWRIVESGGRVVLQYQMQGSAPDYGVLSFQNGSTYLDRSRIFVTSENPHCR